MDVQATVDALRILRCRKTPATHIDPVGNRILDGAIYHMERGLQEYLTRGN